MRDFFTEELVEENKDTVIRLGRNAWIRKKTRKKKKKKKGKKRREREREVLVGFILKKNYNYIGSQQIIKKKKFTIAVNVKRKLNKLIKY